MDINKLVEDYGYIALIIGSLAEGETITILGGIAAHKGLLHFPLVIASIALGGMIGDQLLYLLGLRFGTNIFCFSLKQGFDIHRIKGLIQNHPYVFTIGTRFMYGFRIIGPLLIGASRLPIKVFVPLNIIGAVVWATVFTSLGYISSEVIGNWIQNIDWYLKFYFCLILAIALVLLIITRLWFKFRRKNNKK